MNKIKILREQTKYHSFAFEYPYDKQLLAYCRLLKEKLGWKEFTFYEGKWRCVSPQSIVELMNIVCDDSRFEFNDEIKMLISSLRRDTAHQNLVDFRAKKLKVATDTDFEVRNVKGTPYPYQKVGVEFLVNSGCKAILADAPGVGKTFQALAAAAHQSYSRVLVICPASVKFAWASEARKWTAFRPHIISSGDSPRSVMEADADLFIINYDLIVRDAMLTTLQKMRWDCIICDESHYIKSKTAKRSKAVKILSYNCPRVLFLSGTPFLNRPEELYTSLNIINEKEFPDYYAFTRKYCNGHRGPYGWEAKGATNINELRDRIGKYFIRRTKDEVLKDLPEKLPPIDIPIQLDDATMREYTLAHNEFVKYLQIVKKTPKKKLKELNWGAQRLMRLNELRMITTRGKMEAARETIENIILSGEKVVVFSCYREPLHWLHEQFGNSSVLVTGEVDAEERGDIVKRFQEDPSCIIFLGGMKSAGVGITLTAATNAVFLDYSWTPADHVQAQDRIHRIGSKGSSVNIYQLYAEGTIDEKMVEILEEKQKLFDVLIEGDEVKEDTSVDELLGSMKTL